MFPVKVMIVFPAVLYRVTLFTSRLDGCDVFFSSYIQCSFCFSHVDRSASKINQSETTLEYFDPLQTHKYHTHTHTPCLAVTLCEKLMKAVDSSTPKSYSRNDPKSPISQAILDLIKEKRRLRWLYNSTQDPNTNPPLISCRRKLGPK